MKNDDSLAVASRQKVTVGIDQNINVGGNRMITVGGNQTLTVVGLRSDIALGGVLARIEGSERVAVAGDRHAAVQGAQSSRIGGDFDIAVDGRGSVLVGTEETPSAGVLDVRGDLAIGATGTVRITSAKSIQLRVGDSVLEVGPDEIKLQSKAVTIVGDSSISLVGNGPQLHFTDTALLDAKAVTIKTPESFLKLTRDASLNGKFVKLNCDTADGDTRAKPPKEKPKSLRTRLVDDFDKPFADKPYELVVEGTTYEGRTSSDGMIEQDLPPTALSGELTLWLKQKGESPKLSWQLKLGDLPPLDTPLGVRTRLKNLNYLRTVEQQSDVIEAEAIRSFQRDHGLSVTGVADDATKAALADTHGH